MADRTGWLARRLGSLSIGARFAIGATVCALIAGIVPLAVTVQRVETELTRLGAAAIDQNMKTLEALSR